MLLTPIWPTGSIKRALILTFYGCLEAEWYRQLKWSIDLIQEVEILKMTPKMAVIYSPKTYLTKKRNKNILMLTLYGFLESKWYTWLK